LCSTLYLTDIIELPEDRPYQNPIVLHQKYVLERATLAQIAKELLCSRFAVRQALIKANIPLRTDAEYIGGVRTIPYGTAVVKGRRVPSQPELRVIDTIAALRQDGMSFDRIAASLTSLGVPTKTRRKKWNGGCVRAIYLKHGQHSSH
jgi:uncharacterized protein (DUF433 family)